MSERHRKTKDFISRSEALMGYDNVELGLTPPTKKPPHLNRRDGLSGFNRGYPPRVSIINLLGVERLHHMVGFQRLNLCAFDHLLQQVGFALCKRFSGIG